MRVHCRLTPAMVSKYPFIQFQVDPHNNILQPCGDPRKQALPTFFILENADIEREIQDWLVEWLTQYETPLERQIEPQEGSLENPTQLCTNSIMQEPVHSSQEHEAKNTQDQPKGSHNDPTASGDLSEEQARKRRGKHPMDEYEDEDSLSLLDKKR